LESAPGVRARENLRQLVPDSLRADHANFPGQRRHRRQRGRLDQPIQIGRKPHTPQQAEFVFREPGARIANGPHHVPLDVRPAAHEINDFAGERVLKQAIDGEVAALRILFRCAIAHRRGTPAIEVGRIGSKGRHFELVAGFQH